LPNKTFTMRWVMLHNVSLTSRYVDSGVNLAPSNSPKSDPDLGEGTSCSIKRVIHSIHSFPSPISALMKWGRPGGGRFTPNDKNKTHHPQNATPRRGTAP